METKSSKHFGGGAWAALVLSALLGLTLGLVVAGGCTMLYPCGAENREICVGSDCECGDRCSVDDQSECGSTEVCAAYAYDQSRGVCVDQEFADRHDGDLLILGAQSSNGNGGDDDCNDDDDCDDGEICDDGECVDDEDNGGEDECEDDSDCANGEVCEAGECVAEGTTGCDIDDECGEDEICDDGECVHDGTCDHDSDCPVDGEICDDGECVDELQSVCDQYCEGERDLCDSSAYDDVDDCIDECHEYVEFGRPGCREATIEFFECRYNAVTSNGCEEDDDEECETQFNQMDFACYGVGCGFSAGGECMEGEICSTDGSEALCTCVPAEAEECPDGYTCDADEDLCVASP